MNVPSSIRCITVFALTLVPVFATTVTAQTTYTTSPVGMGKREGASHFLMANQTRYQVIDKSQATGRVKSIQSIAFRRNSTTLVRESGGTVHITMKMGHGLPIGHVNGDPSKNWLGKPTTVFNKSTNFPSWTLLPRLPPSRFDFEIPFANKLIYSGTAPLAWEMTWANYSSRNGRSLAQHFDSAMRKTVVVDAGTAVGTGCGSFQTRSNFLTAGPSGKTVGMQVSVSGTGAPAGSPVFWSLDLKDSNLTIPTWCARLHVLPTILVPLGTANAQGRTDVHGFAFPYDKNIQNVSVFSQLVGSSAGNIYLAQATKNTIPFSNTNNEAFETAEVWHPLSASSAARVTYGGSIVARLKH